MTDSQPDIHQAMFQSGWQILSLTNVFQSGWLVLSQTFTSPCLKVVDMFSASPACVSKSPACVSKWLTESQPYIHQHLLQSGWQVLSLNSLCFKEADRVSALHLPAHDSKWLTGSQPNICQPMFQSGWQVLSLTSLCLKMADSFQASPVSVSQSTLTGSQPDIR